MLRMLNARTREAHLSQSAQMRYMHESPSNDVPWKDAQTTLKPSSATPANVSQRNDLHACATPVPSDASGSSSAVSGTSSAVSGATADGNADERRRIHSLTRMRGNEDRGGGR